MLTEQKMTSDGITSGSLLAIYQAMYHRFEVLREKPWAHLLPSRSLAAMHASGNGYQLSPITTSIRARKPSTATW